MASEDDNDDQPRVKRMRKGTKSCAECRRRKIKCIYEPTRPDICRDCFERGSTCIDQEHADHQSGKGASDQSLKGRVSQLEDLVKSLVGKLDEKAEGNDVARDKASKTPARNNRSSLASSTLGVTPPTTHDSPNSQYSAPPPARPVNQRPKADLGTAPIISLFDNAVVTSQGGWDEDTTTATAQDLPDSLADSDKNSRLRRTLVSMLPSQAAYRYIIKHYGAWWEDWFLMMPEMMIGTDPSLEVFTERCIKQGGAVEMAQVLLNLAMCLQKVPTNDNLEELQLPLPPQQLSDQYVGQVNRLVLCEDDIIGTIDGVLCLITYTKFCMDAGRPRKSWLSHRRAITFAQLLNLHRKSARSVDSKDASSARKNFIWIDLYMLDQFAALLLGQPYTIGSSSFDMDEEYLQTLPLEASFMVRSAQIASRIVDRNQDLLSKSVNTSLSTTLQLDEDLDALERSMPADWWTGELRPGWREGNTRIIIQFVHYHLRVFIHQPFMLKSATEKRFNHNRVSALQAARKMLELYTSLRTNPLIKNGLCKAMDFQAFTSGMLLVLNILGYSTGESDDNWADWSLVEELIELLRSTTYEIGGKVSEQCVRVLELFMSCHKYSGDESQFNGETCQIVVPFFGKLIIAPGQRFDLNNYRSMASNLPTPPTTSESSGTTPGHIPQQIEPFIGFDSYTNPLPMDYLGQDFRQAPLQQQQSNDPVLGFPQAYFNMDLDHDWSWYLGSNDQGMNKVTDTMRPRAA